MLLLWLNLHKALSDISRFFSSVELGDGGIVSYDLLGTIGAVVVVALPLMGSVLPLGVVLTAPLLCGSFGLLSSLDDEDEGEFECWKDSDAFSTTGLEAAAVGTSKFQIIQGHLIDIH